MLTDEEISMQAQPTHPTFSAYRAAAILTAWRKSDAVGLRQELSAIEASKDGVSDALEAERLDLLAGIANELSRDGASSDICGTLLRHTAAMAWAARSPATLSTWVLQ